MIYQFNVWTAILALWVSLLVTLYLFMSRHYNYWKKKNVPYIKPLPLVGNILDIFLLRQSIGEVCRNVYNSSKAAYIGMFVCDQRFLVVRDPQLIKSILVKDFVYFMNRTAAENKRDDAMGSHILFLIRNPDWREIRKRMTPAFSSGKLKLMYKLILDTGKEFVNYLHTLAKPSAVIETRNICSKYTTDAITSTSFGLEANCFKDENSMFRIVSRRVYNFELFWHAVQTTCYFISPPLVHLFRMRFVDTFSANFLRDIFWQTMKERERTKFVRNDLLDILIEMRKEQQIEDVYKLEGDKLVAQATQFFIAGHETTNSTMTFALYELAKQPDIQTRLRDEIIKMKTQFGEFSYEALSEMKYLEMCIEETLRMYPVLPFLDRRCTTTYTIPESNVQIDKGVGVYISLLGLHYDPQYYPDPHKFNPERFSDQNKSKIVSFTYLPFGDGPRNCIGKRFAILSAKSGLAHILSNFEVEVCDQTQKEMKLNPTAFLLAPPNGIRLRFNRLKDI